MKSQQLSQSKLRWFKAIAIFIPIVLLVLAELLLRLFHYGHDTSLFIRYPDNLNYWVMNKYASEPYFSNEVNATQGYIEPFKAEKTPDIFRIFVLGESTTAGYPYFHNGSFHRWLTYRLMQTYPKVHFEIINVALTAVNSYTVLDFGKQVIKYQPDAVLIYTGHNEYYGAMGVGSTSHLFNNRLLVQSVIALRKLRLVQLINNIIQGIKGQTSTTNTDVRKNLMERMAASQHIAYGSPEYETGIHQFQNNMDELCQVLQSKKVPVFLSTLVSNEKDLKPFISDTVHPSANADLQFDAANASYKVGQYQQAKRQYIHAKDLDLLRFRAPEAINKIIAHLTQQYSYIHWVDARGVFERYSPHAILGHETILEHVHPNLLGYALLSDAFYQAIQKAHLIKEAPTKQISFTDLLKKMPVTQVDSLTGAYTIMMLETGWPFNKPLTDFKRGNSAAEQLAGALAVNRISWMDAMNDLFQYSMKNNDKTTALKAVEATLLEHPENTTYYLYSGRLNYELGYLDDAAFYFQKAFAIDPSVTNAQSLYVFYLKSDQPEKAIDYLNIVIQKDGTKPVWIAHKSILTNLIQLKQELVLHKTDLDRKMKIAEAYQRLNEPEVAAKYN